MALNLASVELGCLVSDCTSACDGCAPENALMDDADRIWLSSESKPEDASSPAVATPTDEEPAGPKVDAFPLASKRGQPPQSMTLDLTELSRAQPSAVIHTAGLYCWHGYSSNPKSSPSMHLF